MLLQVQDTGTEGSGLWLQATTLQGVPSPAMHAQYSLVQFEGICDLWAGRCDCMCLEGECMECCTGTLTAHLDVLRDMLLDTCTKL